MRILFAAGVYPPEIGGPATFVPLVAHFLRSQGHFVSVVTYGDARTSRDDGWPVTVIERGGSVFWRYLRYAWQIYQQAKQVDVVFSQGAVSEGFPAAIGAWAACKPLVLRVPGDYAWEQYQQRMAPDQVELLDTFVSHRHTGTIRLLELIERWVAHRAKRVVVPSEYLKRVLGFWGVSEDRISVIYNDVDPLPPPKESRQELQVRFQFDTDARILFTIARAVPWKGIEFLISLLEDLPTHTILVVAGDGPLLASWQQLVHARGLERRVFLLGRWPHAELASWFQAADAFVLASTYEGFPHVAIEAAMQGLPCFLSDAGGNPEATTLLPGFATILPARNSHVWIEALSRSSFVRRPPFIPPFQMAREVERLLTQVVDMGTSV